MPAAAESGSRGSLTQVGRYIILRKLGEGAMGEVYVAYDEKLDRRVAVKLVRAMGQRAGDVYTRMLREAQGLARLSHPNVVQVYEAGEFDGRVYLAMEYIEGASLREWAALADRRWDEVLRCCIEAGRGLAAAHRVDLVHRDFKPDNVIVGEDGRVRVLDFGLVRAKQDLDDEDAVLRLGEDGGGRGASLSVSGTSSLRSDITQAHTLIGTPAYMSPEQHLRETADARSDIFAFCIVLYEVLYGVRPFAGDDQAAIMRAALRQELAEPTSPRRVPAWLRRVVLRGLQVEPKSRWPTMDALLVALENDPIRRWRRYWLVGGFAAALAAAAVGVGYAVKAEAAACTGGALEMRGVWDEARRQAVRGAFAATEVAYAGEVTERVEARLDEFREAWIASYRGACLAHRRGEHSSELLDLRMACLRERRREVDAALRTFVRADADVVEHAVPTISALTDATALRSCDDLELLQRGPGKVVDPAKAARAEAIRGEIADAAALEQAGKSGEGLAALAKITDALVDLDDPALLAEADLARGRLLMTDGAYEAAGKTLRRAYYEARALGHDAVAAAATIDMIRYVAAVQAEADEVEQWTRLADAEVRHLGRAEVVADFHAARAPLYMVQGRFEAALVDYEEALTRRRQLAGDDDPKLAELLRGVGTAHFKRGRNAEARAALEEALATAGRVLGPQHPLNSNILSNLALVAAREGRYDDGIAAAERALTISEGARGRDHPQNAGILSNLGELEIQRGRYEAAAEYLSRAVSLAESSYGADNPMVAMFIGSLAIARYKLGDVDAAQRLMERALARSEASLGADHPNTAVFRANLGEVLNDRGRFAEAKAHIEPALAAMRAALGEDRPELGPVQRELGRALLGLGDLEAAEREARAALDLASGGAKKVPVDEFAKLQVVLAEILVARAEDASAREDPRARDELVKEIRGLLGDARSDLEGHEAEARLIAEVDALERRLGAL
ncbi:MAG: serine/threonine-protein kinase [Nannocystaceae bacterium]